MHLHIVQYPTHQTNFDLNKLKLKKYRKELAAILQKITTLNTNVIIDSYKLYGRHSIREGVDQSDNSIQNIG